jgi:N-acetylmuramoyl-L-alanine amidase
MTTVMLISPYSAPIIENKQPYSQLANPVYVVVEEVEPIEFTLREPIVSRGATETVIIKEEEYPITKEEIELIALVTMAEAEGECEKGKRLVIDTILNRMDSKEFPNTIAGVIYQPRQFTSMWNGRINRSEVRDDIVKLVKEELLSRTNNNVIFFNARHYSQYGVAMFQVENHYFSSYN